MPKEKNKLADLLEKLNCVDKDMCDISEKIEILKQFMSLQTTKREHPEEEVCPDVEESEKAVVEAIEQLYVQELLTREPEGEA